MKQIQMDTHFHLSLIYTYIYFFYLGFGFTFANIHNSQDSRVRERVSLYPLYHYHPLHRHLDISRAITAESSPLHIASSRTLVSVRMSLTYKILYQQLLILLSFIMELKHERIIRSYYSSMVS